MSWWNSQPRDDNGRWTAKDTAVTAALYGGAFIAFRSPTAARGAVNAIRRNPRPGHIDLRVPKTPTAGPPPPRPQGPPSKGPRPGYIDLR